MSITPALAHLPTIGAYAFAVYALLDTFPDLSIRELMRRSDFSTTTIRRAIKALEKAQLVRVDHIDGKPNHYELLNGLPLLANSTTTTDTPTSSSSTTTEQTTPHDFEKSDGFYADADKADGVCLSRVAPNICINTDPDSKTPVSTIPGSVNGKKDSGPSKPRERDPFFDALATLYPAKGQGGWIKKLLGWLQEVEPDVTPERLCAFVADWRKTDKHAADYRDKAKIQSIFGKFISGPPKVVKREMVPHPNFPGTLITPLQRDHILKEKAESEAEIARKYAELQARNGKH